MTTVIDELVVELGLEPSKFTEGQKQALDSLKRTQEEALKVSKEIEAHGKKINEFFGGLKREAVGLLAAFFGGRGAKEFAAFITTANANIGRTATVLQMSSRELAVWQGMARATGGSAESVTGSMKGLSNAVQTFLLTGQGPFLPVMNAMQIGLFKANGELKTAGELLEDIHNAAGKMGPARAKAMLTALGIDENTVNLLIMGNRQFAELRKQVEALTPVTKADTDAAAELATAWGNAVTAAENLGTKIMTKLTPALKYLLEQARDMFSDHSKGNFLREHGVFSNVGRAIGRWFTDDKMSAAGFWDELNKTGGGAGGTAGGTPSKAEVEAYVRRAAAARNIDPNIAARVVDSESGFNVNAYNPEGSYGVAQLFYGGGLGNVFGPSGKDPSTWRQQVDFMMDQASKGGWSPWHGWKGSPRAGIGPVGGGERGGGASTSIKVDTVIVNTKATDADGIARDIKPALERDNFANQANHGQQ